MNKEPGGQIRNKTKGEKNSEETRGGEAGQDHTAQPRAPRTSRSGQPQLPRTGKWGAVVGPAVGGTILLPRAQGTQEGGREEGSAATRPPAPRTSGASTHLACCASTGCLGSGCNP